MLGDNYEIDKTDLKILSLLSEDAKMPYTEIAKQLNVSNGTIHVRLKKMEDSGIVKGSSLSIDYSKLGLDVCAFLGIYLEKSAYYDAVVNELKKIKEIVNIHYTTGAWSIFIKIFCRDTVHLRDVLHDKIQKINGIERTETFISLDESLNRQIHLDTR